MDYGDTRFLTHPMFRRMNEDKYEFAMRFIQSMKDTTDDLIEENEKLKARTDDDIFSELNEKIADLEKQLQRKNYEDSFSFSPELVKKMDEWWQAHISDPEIQERMKKFKSSGHRPTYEITPSEVGWFYGIRCSCGAHYEEMD